MNEERGSSGKSLAAGALCAVNVDITIVAINPQGGSPQLNTKSIEIQLV